MSRSPGRRTRSTLCKGTILLLVVAAVGMVGMAFAPVTLAIAPTGDFAIFKQCPRFTKYVELCAYVEDISGFVTIGKTTVPINEDKKHPIILQGGIKIVEGKQTFVNALNGETMSKTPQKIPGGLTGLLKCSEITGNGLTEINLRSTCKLLSESPSTNGNVSAIIELVGEVSVNTSALEIREGAVFTMPVKVRLENPLLGSNCYIGTNTNPIVLALTAGKTNPPPPNAPIVGKSGELRFKDEFEFLEITRDVLVNNEFAAPEVTGCGGALSHIVDPLIDTKLGLPSASGHNTIVQDGTIYVGGSYYTIKSEK